MNVILFVVDALGVGALEDVVESRPEDINSNTVKSISNYYDFNGQSFWEKVGLFSQNPPKCSYAYQGADSYLGHLEMIGIKMQRRLFNVLDYYEEIVELLPAYKIVANQYYLNLDSGKVFISNNTEGEVGLSINVIGDSKKIDQKEIDQISNVIMQIIKPPRVIAGKAEGFREEDISESLVYMKTNMGIYGGIGLAALRKNVPEVLNTFSYSNITDSIYYGKSLIDSLIENKLRVSLIGKTSTMFNKYDVFKYYGITESCFDVLNSELKQNDKDSFYFINVQDIDTAGHVMDASLGAKRLQYIGNKLEELYQSLGHNDHLIIVGDHGNDPLIGHSNHTREYVPFLSLNHQENKMELIDQLGDIPQYVENLFGIGSNTIETS